MKHFTRYFKVRTREDGRLMPFLFVTLLFAASGFAFVSPGSVAETESGSLFVIYFTGFASSGATDGLLSTSQNSSERLESAPFQGMGWAVRVQDVSPIPERIPERKLSPSSDPESNTAQALYSRVTSSAVAASSSPHRSEVHPSLYHLHSALLI